MFLCEPGDVLLYRRGGLTWDAIKAGEIVEDGFQSRLYAHVAIALNANDKLESDGKKVSIHRIGDEECDVFRPPASNEDVHNVLNDMRAYIGQPYDWWLIVDDALRALTFGIAHFPRKWIEEREKQEKICSSLAEEYLHKIRIGVHRSEWARATPEDIYLTVKSWPVRVNP